MASSVMAATSGLVPEGATVFLKGHGGKDGQVGVLAAGEDGRLDLGQVGHSLDNKEVHARGDAGAHFLGKEVIGLVEAEGTQGAKQRADGADIAGDVVGAGRAGAGDKRRQRHLPRWRYRRACGRWHQRCWR